MVHCQLGGRGASIRFPNVEKGGQYTTMAPSITCRDHLRISRILLHAVLKRRFSIVSYCFLFLFFGHSIWRHTHLFVYSDNERTSRWEELGRDGWIYIQDQLVGRSFLLPSSLVLVARIRVMMLDEKGLGCITGKKQKP